jgi:hypothetical protein
MEELDEFFLSTNKELIATVNRLDKLIGNKHWLTVGTYKETLLKKLLRRVIPDKYSINSGFIVAADYEGHIINSSQTDILIWDSCNYSPLFRDGDFVIIPPESCKIMIEVKGMLTKSEIKKTVYNFDRLINLRKIQFMQDYNISKYIFAYETKRLSYPGDIFNALSNAYENCEYLTLENRLKYMEEGYPSEHSSWPLFKINGIFILTKGFINCSERIMKDDKLKLLFHSYSIKQNDMSNIYSFFETEVLSLLGPFSGGRQGSWYSDQPGLFSLRKQLRISPSLPKSVMILPETDSKYYNNDLKETMVYRNNYRKGEHGT